MSISIISVAGMSLVLVFCSYCFYRSAGIIFLDKFPKIKDLETQETLAQPDLSSYEIVLLYTCTGVLGVSVFACKISNQSLDSGWVSVFCGLTSAFTLGKISLTERHKKKISKLTDQRK